jgi:hypothetical protein
LKNIIIFGLSWLVLHNPWGDCHTKILHLETPKHKAWECEGLNMNMVVYVVHSNTKHEDGCMQNFKHKEDLNHTWGSKCSKMMSIQVKVSMHATKKRDAFMIHVFPTIDVKSH